MKGDFSRMTFDPGKQYLRVLMQQGRVQLDADWNEQIAILLHNSRLLAQDLIGPHGGPAGDCGFAIAADGDKDLTIGEGRYYVGGVPCENRPIDGLPISYYDQPYYPLDRAQEEDDWPAFPFLVYLDVWERHVTYNEDGHIREVALGGPDTATRSQIVWQVKLEEDIASCNDANDLLETRKGSNRGLLRAKTDEGAKETDACTIRPDSRYRGEENQLYRVEIHRSGRAGDALYKWSRDNGAIFFPIYASEGASIELTTLGRDSSRGLNEGDIVEVVDEPYDLHLDWPERPLLQVASIDRMDMRVKLAALPGEGPLPDLPVYDENDERYPLLRRWDGYGKVQEGRYRLLEDNIQIQFAEGDAEYQRGDYWLIPARVATGDVEWPQEEGADGEWTPKFLPPQGIIHYYAPLAILSDANSLTNCRQRFAPSASTF